PEGSMPAWDADEGYAVRIRDGQKSYVVALLRGWDHWIPGRDTQYLYLFGADGRFLDRLSCYINSRLTRMFANHNKFLTEVLESPEPDGAQFVIRYIPENGGRISGNWSHQVTHQGKTTSYAWDEDEPGVQVPGELDLRGLCRVA